MRTVIFSLVMLLATTVVWAGGMVVRTYDLPGHGTLVLKMPASWKSKVAQPPNGLPPTIHVAQGEGAPFKVLFTPIWPLRADIKLPTQAKMKSIVKHMTDRVAQEAVEKTLKIRSLKGKTGSGYFFAATDRAPKPGEFKILTQGMIKTDGLIIAFTILTNDGQQNIVHDALSMLSAAIHR